MLKSLKSIQEGSNDESHNQTSVALHRTLDETICNIINHGSMFVDDEAKFKGLEKKELESNLPPELESLVYNSRYAIEACLYILQKFPSSIAVHVQTSSFIECYSDRQRWTVKANKSIRIIQNYQNLLQKILKMSLSATCESCGTCSEASRYASSLRLTGKCVWSIAEAILDWADQDLVTKSESSSFKINLKEAQEHRDIILSCLLKCFTCCVKYDKLMTKLTDETYFKDKSRFAVTALGILIAFTFLPQNTSLLPATCGTLILTEDVHMHPLHLYPKFTDRMSIRFAFMEAQQSGLKNLKFDALENTVKDLFSKPVATFTEKHKIRADWATGHNVQLNTHDLAVACLNDNPRARRLIVEEALEEATSKILLCKLLSSRGEQPSALLELVMKFGRANFFGRLEKCFHENISSGVSMLNNPPMYLTPSAITREAIQSVSKCDNTTGDLLVLVKSSRKVPDRFPSGIYDTPPPEHEEDQLKANKAKTPSWHLHLSRIFAPLRIISCVEFSILLDKEVRSTILDEAFPVIFSLLDDYKPVHQTLGAALLLHIFSNAKPEHFEKHYPMIQQVLTLSTKASTEPTALGSLTMCLSSLLLLSSKLEEEFIGHSMSSTFMSTFTATCQLLFHKARASYNGLEIMNEGTKGKTFETERTVLYNEGRRVASGIIVGALIPLLLELHERIKQEGSTASPGINSAVGVQLAREGMLLFLPTLTEFTPYGVFADDGTEFYRIISSLSGILLLVKCASPIIHRHGSKIMTAIMTVVGRISQIEVTGLDPRDLAILDYSIYVASFALKICKDRANQILCIIESNCIHELAEKVNQIRSLSAIIE